MDAKDTAISRIGAKHKKSVMWFTKKLPSFRWTPKIANAKTDIKDTANSQMDHNNANITQINTKETAISITTHRRQEFSYQLDRWQTPTSLRNWGNKPHPYGCQAFCHKSNIARFVVITHLDCNNWVTTRAHVKETTFSQMPMTAIIQFNAKVTANTHWC